MPIFSLAVEKESKQWVAQARKALLNKEPTYESIAQRARHFIAALPTASERIEALAAWYHNRVHLSPLFAKVLPPGAEELGRLTSNDQRTWLAFTAPPTHKAIQEAATVAFAFAAPLPWLMQQWEQLVAWSKDPREEVRVAMNHAILRLAKGDPAWLRPHWRALLRAKTAREVSFGVRALLTPMAEQDLDDALDELLSTMSAMPTNAAETVGLAMEGLWQYGLRSLDRPLDEVVLRRWLRFFSDARLEAPEFYFVGRTQRSLFGTALGGALRQGWPEPLVQVMLAEYRRDPVGCSFRELNDRWGWSSVWHALLLHRRFDEARVLVEAVRRLALKEPAWAAYPMVMERGLEAAKAAPPRPVLARPAAGTRPVRP